MAIETVKEFARVTASVGKASSIGAAAAISSARRAAYRRRCVRCVAGARRRLYRGGQIGGNPPRNGNGAREHGTLATRSCARKKLGRTPRAAARSRERPGRAGRRRGAHPRRHDGAGPRALAPARHNDQFAGSVCATPAALKAMIDAEVAETMAALYDYDGELDLGEPSKKAARLVRKKYLRARGGGGKG